jgi:choline-sulfatase
LSKRPEIVNRALAMLDQWHAQMMRTATHPADPMWIVMREGGPHHTCGNLTSYLKRLRETGREQWAKVLAEKHASECHPVARASSP